MSESNQANAIHLQGFSTFIISKAPLKGEREETNLIFLRPGLYGIKRKESSINNISGFMDPDFLSLIPRREVSRFPRHQHDTAQTTFRRYVLITYKPFKDPAKRQIASRLLWQTPLIRFQPGLFLAPQIRAIRFREYEPILKRPSEFIRRMVDLGASVWYAPRLEPQTTSSEEIIIDQIRRTFEGRTKRIIETCQLLQREAQEKKDDSQWLDLAKQNFKRIRGRLRRFRAQMRFYRQEFNLDFQYTVSRAAAATSRVYQKLVIRD